ncbi:MAG: hypothetical protein A2744_03320 [Candidatus Buchananbacteria bacterium RIFCSPHIGHO2_01_FULL_44_11]|uniref:Membrane insertase YidC/Oxa/ALB C-terminal domain-containing protein n=1 Tax=Candidatus Buchananbacteria bacterium RIFCSPHIGHO2_01_FULL_44_11 TaxID=1797535 RepID=A0A1G1Y287_9BACT|nr:MAG: hypothetical protein A2744_03320 [Candidatus Buchananbacteria bacterium RIFCSPHIGHO2_01_FULL_44_11]
MEILNLVWDQYLYIPLFNLLIWLYLNFSFFNLGIAVIILTIILRIVLLPLSYMTERAKIVRQQLDDKVDEIAIDFANDPVKKKLAIRRYLKTKRIHPWAKTLSLVIQGLVLVLLYQVFVGGINSQAKLHLLYASMARPDFINTNFLWFDISKTNLLAASIVAAYIFGEILIEQFEKKNKEKQNATRRELFYILFFPAGVFLTLALLPAVKSIFILTSLMFSTIISLITFSIVRAKKIAKPQGDKKMNH